VRGPNSTHPGIWAVSPVPNGYREPWWLQDLTDKITSGARDEGVKTGRQVQGRSLDRKSSILVPPARREMCQGTKLNPTTTPRSPYFAQPRLEEKSVLVITASKPSFLGEGCDIRYD